MSTTIGRDHVVNLVIGNRHPFAIHFDFVVVANHATLGRATIHQVAARTLAVISFELRVEALMPFIVTFPVIPLAPLRLHKDGERAAQKRDELAPSHSKGHLGMMAVVVSDNPLSPDDYKARLTGIDGLSHVNIEVHACPGHSLGRQAA